jgi:hypothetical protein
VPCGFVVGSAAVGWAYGRGQACLAVSNLQLSSRLEPSPPALLAGMPLCLRCPACIWRFDNDVTDCVLLGMPCKIQAVPSGWCPQPVMLQAAETVLLVVTTMHPATCMVACRDYKGGLTDRCCPGTLPPAQPLTTSPRSLPGAQVNTLRIVLRLVSHTILSGQWLRDMLLGHARVSAVNPQCKSSGKSPEVKQSMPRYSSCCL